MTTLHIANTQFESELQGLQDNHPVHDQLQFLPLLYASPEDLVLANWFPPDLPKTPKVVDKDHITEAKRIESWGPSAKIQEFAKQHHLEYDIPPIDVVKTVASKFYPIEQGFGLPTSLILNSQAEIDHWINNVKLPFVLKKPFATAGRGHKIFKCKADLHYEFKEPVLAEPWVSRECDFSTQWNIEKSGKIVFIGWTIMDCNEFGKYRATHIKSERPNFINAHIEQIQSLLNGIVKLGFFGQLGIDGFTYNGQLNAACEINPRKTMGWVALKLCEKLQTQTLSMFYCRGKKGLLPTTSLGLQLTVTTP
ncbi:MAG: ATP-grasp domain-containing protein [Chlamydiia bacterium]|nr:ATP-grasp domain-containing protein [Chlamydiia bacterium]